MSETINNDQQALVPRLRFPEFQEAGEWTIRSLSKVGKNMDSKRVPITEKDRIKGDIPYYGASGIIDYVRGHIFDEELLCISEDGANLVARTYPIAFSISGKTWVNNHAHVLKFEEHFTQVLVENYLNSISLEDFLTGMAQPKLNRAKLNIIPIPLPAPAEQQKIADCLSSLDALIAAQGEKLDALKTHEKGLMQQLFPREGETVPRLRFPEFRDAGEWEKKLLKDVAPLQRGFDLPTQKLEQGEIPVVYSNGVQNYHSIGMAKGPGLITGRSGTIGKLHYIAEGDYWPHNTALWVTSFKDNVPKFIYFFYAAIGMERFVSGSGVPTLNRNYVHAFAACIPRLKEEQQKIADCLSSLDALIVAQSEKLDALKTHKKGLMQQLFPVIDRGES